MSQKDASFIKIYIDADGCAVKEEVYKVADRYQLVVFVVANQYLKVPFQKNIVMKVVSDGFDAADDWIVENITESDILVTSDILLAERAIKKHTHVLGPKGHEMDEENIGSALAIRELNTHLRDLGHKNTGPSSMTKKDRSQFLSSLDRIIQKLLRR